MVSIFDAVLDSTPADSTVLDISVGIFWTFVRTQYGSGLCATAHRWCEDPPGAIIPMAGNIVGMTVRDLASLYHSESLSARAVAIAAVSASCGPLNARCENRRAQDLIADLCRGQKRRIALIGHFHFGEELRELGQDVDTYELDHRCGEGDIPVSRAPELLPHADILVMTSSTLVTHATEELISWASPSAYKLIVGPSVPLSPVLWNFGIDAICGCAVTDPQQVAVATRQGANHKQLTGTQKVCYFKN